MTEIPKAYEPALVEQKWYKFWMDQGYFKPKIDKNKKPLIHYQLVPMNDHIVADSSIQKYIDEIHP